MSTLTPGAITPTYIYTYTYTYIYTYLHLHLLFRRREAQRPGGHNVPLARFCAQGVNLQVNGLASSAHLVGYAHAMLGSGGCSLGSVRGQLGFRWGLVRLSWGV